MKTGHFMSEASKMTLECLKESLSDMWEKAIWLPSSPNCKPLDCFVCGVSEGHRGEGLQEVQVQF